MGDAVSGWLWMWGMLAFYVGCGGILDSTCDVGSAWLFGRGWISGWRGTLDSSARLGWLWMRDALGMAQRLALDAADCGDGAGAWEASWELC